MSEPQTCKAEACSDRELGWLYQRDSDLKLRFRVRHTRIFFEVFPNMQYTMTWRGSSWLQDAKRLLIVKVLSC